MAIVTEWEGRKVPEGSTRVNKTFSTLFYKKVDGELRMFDICHPARGWHLPFSDKVLCKTVELPEAEADMPDWGKAPSDTAVWIVPVKGTASDWHELSADGLQYNKIGSTSYWTIDDDDDEYYIVHRRPMDCRTPLLKNKAASKWVDGLPPIGCSVLLNITPRFEDGFLFSCNSSATVKIPNNTELVVIGHCTRHDNQKTCATLMAKDCNKYKGFTTVNPDYLLPLKTKEEIKKEAFVDWASSLLNGMESTIEEHHGMERAISIISDSLDSMPKGDES